MADTFISSRRLNMYLSEKKHIDDTIFEYFKDIDNRQDMVKMILYDYIKEQGETSNEFSTKKKQKSEGVVKKSTPKKPKKVTNKSQDNNEKDTEITPISDNFVTKNTQESVEKVTQITQEEHKKETKDTQISDTIKEQKQTDSKKDEIRNKLVNNLAYFNKK